MSWRQSLDSRMFQILSGLPPPPACRGFLPGWTVVCMLPSSSVSETKMVSADGPDDFLGDFPDRSWATVFPDVGSATEFTIMLVFLVFAPEDDSSRHGVQFRELTRRTGYNIPNPIPSPHSEFRSNQSSICFLLLKVGQKNWYLLHVGM